MLKTEQTFEVILNANITAKIAMEHAKGCGKLFNTRAKVEKAYKRKVDRLADAAQDVINFTDFLMNHKEVRAFSDAQAESHEAFLYLFAELDINQRARVYSFIMDMQREQRVVGEVAA